MMESFLLLEIEDKNEKSKKEHKQKSPLEGIAPPVLLKQLQESCNEKAPTVLRQIRNQFNVGDRLEVRLGFQAQVISVLLAQLLDGKKRFLWPQFLHFLCFKAAEFWRRPIDENPAISKSLVQLLTNTDLFIDSENIPLFRRLYRMTKQFLRDPELFSVLRREQLQPQARACLRLWIRNDLQPAPCDLAKWNDVLSHLQVTLCPSISTTAQTAVVEMEGKAQEDVRDIFFWNLNGLRARWNAAKLPFTEVISHKNPDLVVLSEVRCDFSRLWRLPGFEEFLFKKGYLFCFFLWSRTGIGKAGLAAFSKTKPLDFLFGLGDQAFDAEGRVISLLFRDVIVVGTYNPQGGFTTESLAEKVAGKSSWEFSSANWGCALDGRGGQWFGEEISM
jgi:hypothetical protein